jgi:serine protease Do
MLPASRHRLLALSLVALLLVGGTVAGIALRPDRADRATTSATLSPAATREAVARASSLSDAFIAISAAVTPAVVRIEVERRYGRDGAPLSGQLRDLFDRAGTDEPETIPQLAGGSGFIVSDEGYILTNNHVIADADRITVILRDNRVFDATLIGTDAATDLAVIRIDAPGLSVVRFGDSDQARVGEWVLAVGNPGFGDESPLDFTVTTGIISAKNRPLDIPHNDLQEPAAAATATPIEDFIQTDAVINPGNSGGPLVDLQGSVIGVNTAIASTTGFSQGYGFAIPANLAQRVMRDLIEHGYVHRALLGISIKDVASEDADVYRLPSIAGVVVEDFAEGSPAERSGLQRHDVIVEVDGRLVQRVGELQRLIALHHPGDVVPLTIIRYGERSEVRVRLMEAPGTGRPQSWQPAPIARELGIQVEELTPVLARQLGYPTPGGAIISRVAPASPADRKDVDVGQRIISINGNTIETLAEAQSVLEQVRSGQIVSLLLQVPEGRTFIANVRKP